MDWSEILEKLQENKKRVLLVGLVVVLIGGFFFFKTSQNLGGSSSHSIDQILSNKKSSLNAGNKQVEGKTSRTLVSSKTSESSAKLVTVDIKGSVKTPGVYSLPVDARVDDAIQKAGGFVESADQKTINLAQKLQDEQVIYVASKNEKAPIAGASSTSPVDGTTGASSSEEEKVNINTADLAGLQNLSGIGEKKAQDIIDYRTKNGLFKSADDLKNVSGFGDKTVERLKDSIVTE